MNFKHHLCVSLVLMTFLFCSMSSMNGQNRLWQLVAAKEKAGVTLITPASPLFSNTEALRQKPLPKVLKAGTRLTIDLSVLAELCAAKSAGLHLVLPQQDGSTIALDLVETPITGETFTTEGSQEGRVSYKGGVHYRGVVSGKPNSIAAISIFENSVMGLFSDETGNHVLGKLEDGSGDYILYNDTDLTARSKFKCADLDYENDRRALPNSGESVATIPAVLCKKVTIYWEGDYLLYQANGSSVANTTNYLTGLFNQVAVLYANEGVSIELVKTKVFTAPDGYPTGTSNLALDAFVAYWNGLNNNFGSYTRCNGAGNQTTEYANLAHLISRYQDATNFSPNGGLAYVDVLCSRPNAYAYSNVDGAYSTVPTYSWDVNCVAHETGHNFGSNHTHNCTAWAGGMIDGCGPAAGYCDGGCPATCTAGPIPTVAVGGTIMSYCHLLGNSSVNLANGFGPLPQAKIRTSVSNAACLKPLITVCASPTNICSASSGAIAVTANSTSATTTSLNYLWSNAATTQSLTALNTAATYTVTATDNNSCTASTAAIVLLLPKAGNGTALANPTLCCNQPMTLNSAAASNLTTCQTVAWLRTTSAITSATQAQTAYTAAVAADILPATSVDALTGAATLAINNNACTTQNYYYTPFVTKKPYAGLASATVTRTISASSVYATGCVSPATSGDYAYLSAFTAPPSSTDPCYTRTYSGWSVTVVVSGYSIVGNSTINMSDGTFTLIKTITGNGTYTYTQADAPSGFNPTLGSTYILIFATCGSNVRSPFTATMNITYPTIAAVTTSFETQCTTGSSIAVNYSASCSNLPAAAFTAGSTSVCSGSPVAFTDQSTGSPIAWAWDVDNNGTTDYVTQNVTHTYPAPGTYTVKLTVSNASGSSTMTKVSYITINTKPTVSISSSGVVACSGQCATLTATGSSAAVGNIGYNWSNGSITATTTACTTAIYTVTATDGNGCTETASISITGGTGTPPTATIAVTGSTCPYTLTATGGGTYLWNTGIRTAILSATASGTYTVTVTNSVGCTATASVLVDCCNLQITEMRSLIYVHAQAVTFPTPTVTGCTTGSVLTYFWEFGDGTTSTLASPTRNYTTTGIFNVCLTVTCTAANGTYCRAKCCRDVNIGKNCPTLYPTFAVNMPATGLAYTFTGTTQSTSIIPAPTSTYEIYNSTNALVTTVTGTSATYTFPNSGEYTVCRNLASIADANYGAYCANKNCRKITVMPTIGCNAAAKFVATTYKANPLNVTFNGSSYSTNATAYYWEYANSAAGPAGPFTQLGTAANSILGTPTFLFPAAGFYWVRLTVNKGTACETSIIARINLNGFTCTSSSSTNPNRTVNPDGSMEVGNSDINDGIGLYPNPTDSNVIITFGNDIKATTMVKVFDMKGSLISSFRTQEGDSQTVIDLSNQAAGVYLFHIENENGERLVKKVIKE